MEKAINNGRKSCANCGKFKSCTTYSTKWPCLAQSAWAPIEKSVQEDLKEDANDMFYMIKNILNDLPSNKDWLDPDLEKGMRDLVKRHTD